MSKQRIFNDNGIMNSENWECANAFTIKVLKEFKEMNIKYSYLYRIRDLQVLALRALREAISEEISRLYAKGTR